MPNVYNLAVTYQLLTERIRRKLNHYSSEIKNPDPEVSGGVTVCSPSGSHCWMYPTAHFLMFGSMCESPKELG